MDQRSFRILGSLIAGLALLSGAVWCWAATPQTIEIDGVNDFLGDNLIEEEAGDTEHSQIDLQTFYLTNDAINLYLGIGHDQDVWTTVQLGIAIDVGTPAGGTVDPWGRQIEWSIAPLKPDFILYVNLDNNWQDLLKWNEGTQLWDSLGPPGIGGQNWATGTDFKEFSILLGVLDVSSSDVINLEAWVTQDGVQKGPLDCLVNDGSQLSAPGGTIWETPAPIPLGAMLPYTVQFAPDPDPPVVESTKLTGNDFPAESFFDVLFSEPVQLASSQNPANYAIGGGGGGGAVVVAAVRDPAIPNVVHLEVAPPMAPSGSLYTVTVTGVQDNNGNPILENGTDNVACFMIKHAIIRGLFGPYLQNNSDPPDEFSIEGDVPPLTFTQVCDTGNMTDTGTDDIWEWEGSFHVSGDCQAGSAQRTLEWKFAHKCTTYEPLASNRVHVFDLANGAQDILEFWWADEDPTAFTQHEIDVEFFVDMNLSPDWFTGALVSVNGDTPPLNWNVPSETFLNDDGNDPDETAMDGIYSARIRFPAGAQKNVQYKYLLEDEYECIVQDNRPVFLNDELYDIEGGQLGPLTLDLVKFDFCQTLWRAVEVVFQCDLNETAYEELLPGDVISVNGTPNNAEPPTFDWSVPSLNPMRDDGIDPDETGGDLIFTASVVFPDTSKQNIEYKYLYNDLYECVDFGNRTASIDPNTYDAVGNPQILQLDRFQNCFISGIEQVPTRMVLDQNVPNPFNPRTEIRFSVLREGAGSLKVFDVQGHLVRTLRTGHFAAGSAKAVWDGLTETGSQAGSGVYFYRLEVGGDVHTKSMMLLK